MTAATTTALLVAALLAATVLAQAPPTVPTLPTSSSRRTEPTRDSTTTRPTPSTPTRPTPPGSSTPRPALPCAAWNVTSDVTCALFCKSHNAVSNYTAGTTGGCCCQGNVPPPPTSSSSTTRRNMESGIDTTPTMPPRPQPPAACCSNAGGGNDPHNPANCNIGTTFQTCASTISYAVYDCTTNCTSSTAPAGSCYECVSKVFSSLQTSIATCCPCLWLYAQARGLSWLELDC